MRLIRAELLKARRRTATWVLLTVALVLMGLSYLLIGLGMSALRGDPADFGLAILEFPAQYATIGQFAFGIGGLLATVYVAALVGSDWNWGVLRNVIARGESRANYLLAKGAGLAIVLGIGMLVIFAAGVAMVFIVGLLFDVPVASPLRGRGLQDLAENLVLGYPVLLQRAALGFVVAVVMRSQLAGSVVGIALWLGEGFLTTVLTLISIPSNMGGFIGDNGIQQIGPVWYQFLPISIGGYVLNVLPGGSGLVSAAAGGGLQGLFLKPVPLEMALPIVLIYLLVAIGVGIISLNRQEIV